ncbi:LacI family DNA-binding transcriptional regulator [Lysinimonas soli]|uniref:LacI family DNA-binding transcriptional regulator n=1 Tax=Lysinimonas soli TaxID=1074233 RepID=A0ABW0NTK5_9MICO
MTDEARRGPTMHDVARLAGVSHVTVSRVLNDYPSIRPGTRERVLAAIRELGYRRNLAARTLVTSRSRAIGVLAPAVPQHGPASSVLAVESAARAHGYHPLVTAAAVDRDATVASLNFLLDQAVEALVVIAPHESVLAAIHELELTVPFVTLQAPEQESGVGVDQVAGAALATGHLIGLGHRRIQHVSGPRSYLEAAARRRGFEQSMTAAGLEPGRVVEGDWTAEFGYRAVALLDPATTAVVAANDQMAIGVIAALLDAGRSVPGEVSVVGFDDVPEAEFVRPSLTTVHQDFDEVGRRAIEVLVAALTGAEPPARQPIEPWLVVRASTARVAADLR